MKDSNEVHSTDRFLFCNIGEMNSYNGSANERPVGGGSYNKTNIGHEVNNFTDHDGRYYGFVQAVGDTIDITRNFGVPRAADYIDDVTVIWHAAHRLVGFYKHARVYRKLQHLDDSISQFRVYSDFNICSDEALLITPAERKFVFKGGGHSNVWYGNDETIAWAQGVIQTLEQELKDQDRSITSIPEDLEGYEVEILAKARVNQGRFRKLMLDKYNNKCCLCGVHSKTLLIASHIKPWNKSNSSEKLSEYNGLLLCPNHDKLFDLGMISFNNDGSIIISDTLDQQDKMFLNIFPDMHIETCEDMYPYLEYHRNNIFK